LAVLASEQRVNNICGNITNGPFDQLIINEYKPGQQIAPHTDHVTQFGPVIACITLGQQVPITFGLGLDKKILEIEPGSMYIMTDEARYRWTHSLKNTSQGTRYSLTYRTMA
jgi:alkylated DNA repair dioxygenase AlkB